MNSLSSKRSPSTKSQGQAKEAFRSRILSLLAKLGEASDVAVWQASAPEYFPWNPYFQELKALHAEGQLQLEMLAPGHWIVRSLAFVQAQASQPSPPQKTRPKAKTTVPLGPTNKPQRKAMKAVAQVSLPQKTTSRKTVPPTTSPAVATPQRRKTGRAAAKAR